MSTLVAAPSGKAMVVARSPLFACYCSSWSQARAWARGHAPAMEPCSSAATQSKSKSSESLSVSSRAAQSVEWDKLTLPGTTHVLPFSGPTSVKYQTVLRAMQTSGNGCRTCPPATWLISWGQLRATITVQPPHEAKSAPPKKAPRWGLYSLAVVAPPLPPAVA